nr:probable E3 ubiquitin ligase complex SCF subunit sconB [Ipomoea batatas]
MERMQKNRSYIYYIVAIISQSHSKYNSRIQHYCHFKEYHIISTLVQFCVQMERLPMDVCLKILGLLDHHNLLTAQLVCRE